MKLVIAVACLAASLALATHALADGRTVATLQQPLAKPADLIVDGTMWRCDGATCVAFTPEQTLGVNQCRGVALKAGPVADIKNDVRTLQPAALDKCNAGLEPRSTVASAH